MIYGTYEYKNTCLLFLSNEFINNSSNLVFAFLGNNKTTNETALILNCLKPPNLYVTELASILLNNEAAHVPKVTLR